MPQAQDRSLDLLICIPVYCDYTMASSKFLYNSDMCYVLRIIVAVTFFVTFTGAFTSEFTSAFAGHLVTGLIV